MTGIRVATRKRTASSFQARETVKVWSVSAIRGAVGENGRSGAQGHGVIYGRGWHSDIESSDGRHDNREEREVVRRSRRQSERGGLRVMAGEATKVKRQEQQATKARRR